MKRVRFVQVVSVLVLVALLMPLGTGVAWAFQGDKTTPTVEQKDLQDRLRKLKNKRQKYEVAIRRMEAYLYVGKDGLLHMDKTAAELGIDPAIYRELWGALQITNDRIRKGELRLQDVALSHGKNIFGAPVSQYDAKIGVSPLSCDGRSGVVFYLVRTTSLLQ